MRADPAPARIDADVHLAPPDLATLEPYLTAHWRDYMREHGFKRPPGVAHSYPSKSPLVVGTPPRTTLEEIRTNVLNGASHAIAGCYFGVESVRNPYMSGALATAINSWLQAEWLGKEERLFGNLTVPLHATDLAVQEIRRAGRERRFVQLAMPVRSWEPYGNQLYWPIYEAALDAGLALGIHFGGLTGMPPTPLGHLDSTFEEHAAAPQLFEAQLLSLVAEGVFDRYPDLRVCLIESGVTWLSPWLWRMDTEWKAARREIPWVRRRPTEYVRKHVRLTIQPFDAPEADAEVRQILEHLGSDDMLMYSSDYPHEHASDTGPLLALLSPAQRDRVLRGNAWDFYGLGDRIGTAATAS